MLKKSIINMNLTVISKLIDILYLNYFIQLFNTLNIFMYNVWVKVFKNY
jgi:hypothetical protein